mmetsp:Transcript_17340/g.17020  ORF Transcript_17340/g.17020 Transcript_17340/m.17020 type:complete len:214 (+) Transcript_17340:24-665(+)
MGATISNCCQLEAEGISPYQNSYLNPGKARELSKRSNKVGKKKNVRFVDGNKSTAEQQSTCNASSNREEYSHLADASSPSKKCMDLERHNANASLRNSQSGLEPSFIKHVQDIKSIFVFDEKIGDGKFGTVFLAHPRNDLESNVAIKLIPQESFSHRIEKELLLLKNIDHNNVIRYISAYKDNEYYYIVTEHCEGGELFQKITDDGCIDELEA